MTKHKHGHDHQQKQPPKTKKGVHTDWRAWVVVVLMLGAILVYVLTDDESLVPGGVEQAVPEAAE